MYGTDVLDAYLMSIRSEGHSPKTISTYRRIIRGWGRYLDSRGSHVLRATTDDLVAYRCHLQDKQLAARTQQLYATVLRCLHNWLHSTERMAHNPAARLKRLRMSQSVAEPPAIEEFWTLVSSIEPTDYEGARDRAIFLALFGTGLRISELCSLRAGQIDFRTREFEVVGKGAKKRVGIIHEAAAEAVLEYALHWRPTVLNGAMRVPLWLSRRGAPMSPNRVREMMHRRRHAAGIDSVRQYPSGASKASLTPHNIRALYATELWRNGASLPVVQSLLGHESMETTRVYLGVSSADLHAAVPLLRLEQRERQAVA